MDDELLLLAILNGIRATMKPPMPAGERAVLLSTVLNPGATLRQLCDICGITPAACSRYVANLEGHELVMVKPDPESKRQKNVYPTAKAKRWSTSLTAAVRSTLRSRS